MFHGSFAFDVTEVQVREPSSYFFKLPTWVVLDLTFGWQQDAIDLLSFPQDYASHFPAFHLEKNGPPRVPLKPPTSLRAGGNCVATLRWLLLIIRNSSVRRIFRFLFHPVRLQIALKRMTLLFNVSSTQFTDSSASGPLSNFLAVCIADRWLRHDGAPTFHQSAKAKRALPCPSAGQWRSVMPTLIGNTAPNLALLVD